MKFWRSTTSQGEKQKLCIKGDVVLRTGGKELDLSALKDGIEFFAGQLKELEWIHVRASAFMTVENYTSWLRLSSADRAVFLPGRVRHSGPARLSQNHLRLQSQPDFSPFRRH